MKTLIQLKILLPLGISDAVSDLLMGLEAQSVSIQEKDEVVCELNSYFDPKANIKVIVEKTEDFISFIVKDSGEETGIEVSWNKVKSESWEAWKNKLKTVKASRRIVIKPPWEDYMPENEEKLIEINPSVAFGTGHHETTTLCIKLMDDLFKVITPGNVLDVGCGSGILGISAVKLGAECAVCLDNDYKASRETLLNSKSNCISDRIFTFTGTLHSVDFKFNLIVSNIYAETLIKLRENFEERTEDNGYLILSGITLDKKNAVIDSYSESRFELIEEKIDGNWAGLIFKNSN